MKTAKIELTATQAGILLEAILGVSWPGKLLDEGVAMRDKLQGVIKDLSVEADGKGPHL